MKVIMMRYISRILPLLAPVTLFGSMAHNQYRELGIPLTYLQRQQARFLSQGLQVRHPHR